jgi:hypothetical protein
MNHNIKILIDTSMRLTSNLLNEKIDFDEFYYKKFVEELLKFDNVSLKEMSIKDIDDDDFIIYIPFYDIYRIEFENSNKRQDELFKHFQTLPSKVLNRVILANRRNALKLLLLSEFELLGAIPDNSLRESESNIVVYKHIAERMKEPFIPLWEAKNLVLTTSKLTLWDILVKYLKTVSFENS